MIKNQIKIILFRGGFVGDLITVLHDYDCFIKLNDNGKIDIEKSRTVLQNDNTMSILEKDIYLEKNKIVSCCDPEFALKNRKHTLIITCRDEIALRFFCKRFRQYHPHFFVNTTIDNYVQDCIDWNNFWPKKFQKHLDISDIFYNENFLTKLDLDLDKKRIDLFEKWKIINKKSFLDHRAYYDQ